MTLRPQWWIAALVVCVTLVSSPMAARVKQADLSELCARAHKVFRGNVVQMVHGEVEIGGRTLPSITYRMKVEEAFKGTFETVKGQQVVEITMLGKLLSVSQGPLQRLALFHDLPRLERGVDYLLFTTAPGSTGLSTTVGLGQGIFHLSGRPGEELALNGFLNRGLLDQPAAVQGPFPYERLAAEIRIRLPEIEPGP